MVRMIDPADFVEFDEAESATEFMGRNGSMDRLTTESPVDPGADRGGLSYVGLTDFFVVDDDDDGFEYDDDDDEFDDDEDDDEFEDFDDDDDDDVDEDDDL